MLQFLFTALFALLFINCSMDDDYHPTKSSSSINNSESSSSSNENLQIISSSSSGTASISSSTNEQRPSNESCDFNKQNIINTECYYDNTVTLQKHTAIGSRAKLRFADNASLKLDGYDLSITGGAELYFGENSELSADGWSNLYITGNNANPVTLTATNANKPWAGIKISSPVTVNIDRMDLSRAVVGITFGSVGVLRNSSIHDNQYGISQNIPIPFTSGSLSGNRFYSNTYDANVSLRVAATLGSADQFRGKLHINPKTPNEKTIDERITLPGFDYQIDGDIIVNNNLTIDAGAHFYFSEFSSIIVRRGSINAIGTVSDFIVFEAANSTDFWGANEIEDADKTAFSFEGTCSGTSTFRYFKVLRAKTAFANYCDFPVDLAYGEIRYKYQDYVKGPFQRATLTINSTPIQ